MTFVPCGDSILLNVKEKMPELFARVVQFASVVENGLTKDLGQDLTLDEIKARLAEKGGSSAAVPAKFDKEFDADSMLDDIIGK